MKTSTKPEVKQLTWEQRTFMTKRANLEIGQLPGFFAGAYHSIYDALGSLGVVLREPPYAIYFSVDQARHTTEVAAAVEVPASIKTLDGFQLLTIPASGALLVTYCGPYEGNSRAYEALDQYVTEEKLTRTYVLEQYFSDPSKESDPAKWRTDVYYLVK